MMDLEKTGSADSFIGTMAEKLGAVARAATVFGEPVERDGITVIPVAKARWKKVGAVNKRMGRAAEVVYKFHRLVSLRSKTMRQTFALSELSPLPGLLWVVSLAYFCFVPH
jgi:transposase InsO family protein